MEGDGQKLGRRKEREERKANECVASLVEHQGSETNREG